MSGDTFNGRGKTQSDYNYCNMFYSGYWFIGYLQLETACTDMKGGKPLTLDS